MEYSVIDEVYSDDSSECSDYYVIDEPESENDTFYVIEKNNKTYLCDTEYEFNLLRNRLKLD